MTVRNFVFLLPVSLYLLLASSVHAQNEISNLQAPTAEASTALLQSWRSSIESQKEMERNYTVPSEARLSSEKRRLAQSLQSLQSWIQVNPGWRDFLSFEALQKSFAESPLDSIESLLTEKLLCKWQVARDSVKNSLVGTISSQVREFRTLLNQWKSQETSETRVDRLQRLEVALSDFEAAPSSRTRSLTVLTVLEMEVFGQAINLCKDIKKQLMQPNLVIRGPQKLFVPAPAEAIDNAFPTSGVYNGLQTSGSGSMTGTRQVSLVRSDTALEYEVSVRGSATTSSQGSNSRVSVQSTAESSLYAAKRAAIFGWGRTSFGTSVARAPTTINYGSIAPQGGRVARREIANQVRASTRSSELQAQQEMEDSLRRQVDQAVETAARSADLTAVYRLRDTLLTTAPDVLNIGWKTYSDHVEVGIKCYNHAQEQLAGPLPPDDKPENWMVALHESLLSNTLQSLLLDSKLGMQYVAATAEHSAKGILVSTETGERVEIAFQDGAAVLADCLEDRIQTTMRVSSLTDGNTTFKDCRIEIYWKPTLVGNELRLDRLDKLRVLPIDFDASKDKLKMRELSAFRVLERALGNTVVKSRTIQLPIADWLNSVGQDKTLRTQNGWLVIECGM